MKKFSLLVLVALIVAFINANATQLPTYKVKKNGYDKVTITFAINDLTATEENGYSILSAEDYQLSREIGKPSLPMMVKMIEIPLCDNVKLTYTLGEAKTYSATELGLKNQIKPAQPSYSKSYRGPIELKKDEETYSANHFYALQPVRIEKNGILRNINLATLYIAPVQYNPVTNEVRVYQTIDVEITFENADIIATNEMKALHGNLYCSAEHFVINPMPLQSKDSYSAPVKYLIVSNDMFKGHLDNFIAWKKRKGFLVEVAYTDDPNVGTTYASIKTYIKSLYTNATPDNPAPTFVLLVGDIAQIPTETIDNGYWSESHPTDMRYFDWTGDDIPDCFYGRFSATTVNHLTAQIEKTLVYEQVTMSDPSYLDEAILIAGVEDGSSGWYETPAFGYTHGNPTITYISDNYVNTLNGYKTVSVFKNPHASTATNTIKNLIKHGAGLINYTAHGDYDRWYEPEFTNTDVNNMTNEGRYPLMIGNCCLTNKFDKSACFGEALLRASKKGAVGYIGGTNSTYWDEDVYWSVGCRSSISTSSTSPTTFNYEAAHLGVYDRLFHTHNESFPNWYTTFGSMVMAGDMAVQASSTDADSKTYYWEIYSLDGDPSVMTWLKQPNEMVVTNDPVHNNATTVNVHAVPYAYVALTDTLHLLAAVFADANGEATLTFEPGHDLNNVELAVSAQNYKTYFSHLTISNVGVKENDNKTYGITPNPACSYIDVTAPAGEMLHLYDVNGRWLRDVKPTDNVTRINIESFVPGYYFVKSGKTTMKFIKK
ncbi:MAG: C25 family cysteine peptidase [Bacteroidales bacterium]|nr:C25 family cysteine peptidase [Bacteroidales bacterium]